MSWLKKAFGVATILGGTAAFGCSGTTQLVGSDGLSVSADDSGAGTAPIAESTYELTQLGQIYTDDERPYLCIPEALPIDPATGNTDCHVLLARPSDECSCAAAGLSPVSDEMSRLTRSKMKSDGWCDTTFSCDLCVCEVDPAVGTSLLQCQTEPEPGPNTTGWCYVSATGGASQNALVEACREDHKQRLRFFGPITDQKIVPQPPTELRYLSCPSQAGSTGP